MFPIEDNKNSYNITLDDYKDRGLTGLANMGNTCYLNSCVQILSHTYEFNEFLKKSNYKKKINKNPDSILLIEWDNLRELMWSENCTIAPNAFINSIHTIAKIKNKTLFTGYMQNDACEFFLFLIECFHNAISRPVNISIIGEAANNTDVLAIKCYNMIQKLYKNEYSELLDMFFGISVSQITSIDEKKILSYTPEPFCILSLSLPFYDNKINISLFDCLDEYCKKEKLENDNAYFNDETKQKENVYKNIIFWNLPKIFIIELKRYDTRGRKLNINVNIPLFADFSKYVNGYGKYSYSYELYGVCNHSGGTMGGHYTSSIKNANGKWYMINDTHINEIESNNLISNKSYCLFYRKKKDNLYI